MEIYYWGYVIREKSLVSSTSYDPDDQEEFDYEEEVEESVAADDNSNNTPREIIRESLQSDASDGYDDTLVGQKPPSSKQIPVPDVQSTQKEIEEKQTKKKRKQNNDSLRGSKHSDPYDYDIVTVRNPNDIAVDEKNNNTDINNLNINNNNNNNNNDSVPNEPNLLPTAIPSTAATPIRTSTTLVQSSYEEDGYYSYSSNTEEPNSAATPGSNDKKASESEQMRTLLSSISSRDEVVAMILQVNKTFSFNILNNQLPSSSLLTLLPFLFPILISLSFPKYANDNPQSVPTLLQSFSKYHQNKNNPSNNTPNNNNNSNSTQPQPQPQQQPHPQQQQQQSNRPHRSDSILSKTNPNSDDIPAIVKNNEWNKTYQMLLDMDDNNPDKFTKLYHMANDFVHAGSIPIDLYYPNIWAFKPSIIFLVSSLLAFTINS